jgi:hypothetical protein
MAGIPYYFNKVSFLFPFVLALSDEISPLFLLSSFFPSFPLVKITGELAATKPAILRKKDNDTTVHDKGVCILFVVHPPLALLDNSSSLVLFLLCFAVFRVSGYGPPILLSFMNLLSK